MRNGKEKTIFITFFNSKIDIDYPQNKYIEPLIVVYNNLPPKKTHSKTRLVHSGELEALKQLNDFEISRYVKFFPSLFIEKSADRFVYFDFRIKLKKKFIVFCKTTNGLYTLPHREGGSLKDEIIRNLTRKRIKPKILVHYLKTFKPNLNLEISENGVFFTNKQLSESLYHDLSESLKVIQRDQLLTPMLLSDKIKKLNFTLWDRSHFVVRSKELGIIGRLKNFIYEYSNLPLWYRKKFRRD